ncbi:MAG TPA: hypothetical protein VFJ19_01540 [Nocardioidaceae bacterium]|nr:hypothetical protein [Nocardioidaceae bacterium]
MNRYSARPGASRWSPRWKALVLRIAGCIVGGAIAALPLAIIEGLTTTRVEDDVGIVPVTLSLQPGHSSLATGLIAGTIYDADLTSHGLGMKIEANGPPADLGSIHSLESPQLKRISKLYTSMFQHPEEIRAGYSDAISSALTRNLLLMELEAGGAIALVAFVVSGLGGGARIKRTTAGTLGALMVLSTGYSVHVYLDWQAENAVPDATYKIGILAGTPLENAVTDSKTTALLIDGVIPLAQAEIEREQQANEEFLTRAYRTTDAQISVGKVAVPGPDESACLLLSDMHANADMIKVYRHFVDRLNQTYGPDTLKVSFLDGDQTYGSAAAKSAVVAMSKITGEQYAVVGNHDSDITIAQMKRAGIHVLNGPAVRTSNGLTAVGVTDPRLTKQGALFVADNVHRPGDEHKTEAAAGRTLRAEVHRSDATLALAHEAYAFGPILDLPDITADAMTQWFRAGSTSPGGDAGDTPDDGVPDLEASAMAYGHWHRRFMYRVASNDDGTWSVVMELGTAGGADSVLSLSHFSTPQTIPGKTASAAMMIVNDTSGLVTSVQAISTDRSGALHVHQAHDIGSPDGLPYPVEPSPAGEAGPSATPGQPSPTGPSATPGQPSPTGPSG